MLCQRTFTSIRWQRTVKFLRVLRRKSRVSFPNASRCPLVRGTGRTPRSTPERSSSSSAPSRTGPSPWLPKPRARITSRIRRCLLMAVFTVLSRGIDLFEDLLVTLGWWWRWRWWLWQWWWCKHKSIVLLENIFFCHYF